MVQKIEATDVTEEEALNAAIFERADEFIKQANEFSRVEKGSQENPAEKRGQVSAAMLFGTARFNIPGSLPTISKMATRCATLKIRSCLISCSNFR
ncbi:UNVERIFIED_CONTAM: DUF3144 domain-containing protein [Staphylococcus haemolyticus]